MSGVWTVSCYDDTPYLVKADDKKKKNPIFLNEYSSYYRTKGLGKLIGIVSSDGELYFDFLTDQVVSDDDALRPSCTPGFTYVMKGKTRADILKMRNAIDDDVVTASMICQFLVGMSNPVAGVIIGDTMEHVEEKLGFAIREALAANKTSSFSVTTRLHCEETSLRDHHVVRRYKVGKVTIK